MIKLVLFDMDGVIFEGSNFWLELHRIMGTERQAWELWTGLGGHSYRRLSELTAARLWAGRSAREFCTLVQEREPVTGIAEVFAYLAEHRIASAIVSSGPYQLAERAQRLFGIGSIRANRLLIAPDGNFSGKVEVQVDDNHKDLAARPIMAALGAEHATTAAVGDTRSDLPVLRLASLSVAYDSSDRLLLTACRHSLAAGEMHRLVELIRAHEP